VKFIDGIKEGTETIWNKNGAVRSKDEYINGKVIK
jgi:antitoxin component YwqK of YwqJK toxin-antitoxin module